MTINDVKITIRKQGKRWGVFGTAAGGTPELIEGGFHSRGTAQLARDRTRPAVSSEAPTNAETRREAEARIVDGPVHPAPDFDTVQTDKLLTAIANGAQGIEADPVDDRCDECGSNFAHHADECSLSDENIETAALAERAAERLAESRAWQQAVTDRLQPEWARADRPTLGMSQAEAAAYYKAHAVAGDCRFALRDRLDQPEAIQRGWSNLLFKVTQAGKETSADRAEASRLRRVWRHVTDLRQLGRAQEAAAILEALPPTAPAKSAPGASNPVPGTPSAPSWKARALAAEAQLRELGRGVSGGSPVSSVSRAPRTTTTGRIVDWAAAGRKAAETRRARVAAAAALTFKGEPVIIRIGDAQVSA